MEPITPTTPATPAAAATPTAPATPVFTPELNAAQAETMAAWIREDVVKGRLTSDQAEQAFNELNTPVENRTDNRSEAAVELDNAGYAPAKPEEYVIHYGVEEQTPELKQFDTAARTWLHGAAFPRELGNSLVTTIGRVTQQTAKMSPDQLVEYGQREMVKLQKTYGDSLGEKMVAANRMIHALEERQPGLKQLLQSKGIGDNAIVASLLIGQAERYWARWRG
ncbi:MAG: hypothetical protein K2X00_13385 [Nitrospiraceae bacterium]|nr:hypothetical protein [Nitrospiraceae bacterium]OQW64750.1 MAG: hypothetical protein BVN29_13180 [Nitrospira sp. ST-bin5]